MSVQQGEVQPDMMILDKTFHWATSIRGWAIMHKGARDSCIYCPRSR